jgi:radical SAM protein with 4Fe4S-binding SPASM domain
MKKYLETLKNSILRKKDIIDQDVMFYNDVPLPSWIEISPIDACNRKCEFCPKSDDNIAPDTFNKMDMLLIKKLKRELELINFRGTVVFAGYGEPLLAKNIFEMISEFSGLCNVEITTNGDPLTSKVARKLVDSGIDKIVVSMYDGPEQDSKFKKIFIDANVDNNKYVLRDRWYSKNEGFGLMLTNRAGVLNLNNQNLPDNYSKKCFYTHYSVMIDWNGDIYLCTQDWNRKVKSGNIKNENFFDIWNSNILKEYRKNLSKGHRVKEPCINCNANGVLHGQKHALAWDSYYKNQ